MNTPRPREPTEPSPLVVRDDVEPWMWEAANEIDRRLGLPRFDLAITWAASIIAECYAEVRKQPRRVRKP